MAERISVLNLSYMNLSNLEQQICSNKASGPFLYFLQLLADRTINITPTGTD